MRPRDALWAMVAVITGDLIALALRGFSATAIGLAVGIAASGAVLDAVYMLTRRRIRILRHRRRLDMHVRLQLAVLLVTAGALAIAGESRVLADASPILQALIVGVAVAATAVYVSSLVDWYWILPRIGGMHRSGLAPCVDVGGEHWAGVTNLWLFHRASATVLVTAVLAAVPGYLAGRTGTGGTESAAWVLLGSALAIGYNSVSDNVATAFREAFNPSVHVGDIVRVRADPEDDHLSDAYVVDVSTQGLKHKLIASLNTTDPEFISKGESVPLTAVRRLHSVQQPPSPCPGVRECRAANWYCFRNVNANHMLDRAARAPAKFDASADDQF